MFKYDVEYTNFEGEQKKETLYFNLTKAELMKLDLLKNGQLKDILEQVVASQDNEGMLYWFDKIIVTAYGQRTPDGLFVKDPNKTLAFTASDAYSEFFLKLLNKEVPVEKFIVEIMPKDVQAQLANEISQK